MKFGFTKRIHIVVILLITAGILLQACEEKKHYDYPVVIMDTQAGEIKVELYPDKAPATVATFLANVDSGFFKRSSFYRVLRYDNQITGEPHSYLIQGGLWEANPELKERMKPIPHESTRQTGILHKRGVISMARNEPGTATTEFFICMQDEPGLDFGGENNHDGLGYAAFGKVIEGMEVAEKIHRYPEHKQRFWPPVVILNIRRAQK